MKDLKTKLNTPKIRSFYTFAKKNALLIAVGLFVFAPILTTQTHVKGVAATISPNYESQDDVYLDSPSSYNVFFVGDTFATTGCHITDMNGTIPNIFDAGGKITSGSTYLNTKLSRIYYGVEPMPEYCDATKVEQIRAAKNIQPIDTPTAYYNYMLNQNKGLFGQLLQANAWVLDQRPASGKVYVEQQVYALKNIGSVSAQGTDDIPFYYPGTGFSLLRPIQGFWGWSVYVTYGFLIILIIFVAFGIILGDKLPGAANITLQTAIPSIAMAMILVPLSYAISGLAIDFVTLGTNAAHEFIMGPGAPARAVYENRDKDNLSIIGIDYPDLGYYADDVRVSWFYAWNNANVKDQTSELLVETKLADNVVFNFVDDALNWIPFVDVDSGETVAGWIGSLISVIISFILFFTGARIFIKLIKKYLVFIIAPIFSPFIFATIAIPGTGTKNIMTYMKMLFAGSLFYITAYSMMLLSLALSSEHFQETVPGVDSGVYVPPLLGADLIISKLHATGGLGTDAGIPFLFSLLSIVVFLSIPKTLDGIDESMGTNKSMLAPIFASTMESAKHSWNTGKVFRNAPGTVMDRIDKTRGVEPGSYGSMRSALRRNTADVRSRLATTAASSDSLVARNLAKVANVGAGGLGRAAGSDGKGSIKPGEDNKIAASFEYNGVNLSEKGGFLTFTRTQMIEMSRKALSGAPDSNLLMGFEVKLKAENFNFPTRLSARNILIYVGEKEARSDQRSAGDLSDRQIAKGMDIFGIDTATSSKGGSLGALSLRMDADEYLTKNGESVSLAMTLTIFDPVTAFGYNKATGLLEPERALLTTGKVVMGRKLYFKYNNVTSNEVAANFQVSEGAQ